MIQYKKQDLIVYNISS